MNITQQRVGVIDSQRRRKWPKAMPPNSGAPSGAKPLTPTAWGTRRWLRPWPTCASQARPAPTRRGTAASAPGRVQKPRLSATQADSPQTALRYAPCAAGGLPLLRGVLFFAQYFLYRLSIVPRDAFAVHNAVQFVAHAGN